jgi:hypothetical protein
MLNRYVYLSKINSSKTFLRRILDKKLSKLSYYLGYLLLGSKFDEKTAKNSSSLVTLLAVHGVHEGLF